MFQTGAESGGCGRAAVGIPIVENALQGYNSSVLAYGQVSLCGAKMEILRGQTVETKIPFWHQHWPA